MPEKYPYSHVSFYIHGGTSGAQQLRFSLRDGQGVVGNAVSVPVQAGQWSEVRIALSALGSPAEIKGLLWQETGGGDLTPFYLDSITLVPAPLPPLALGVDAAAHRQPISPDIYGVDNASEALANAIRLPVRRWGGNARSRYNYQLDTTNTGEDYYFENVSLADSTPGSAADNFVEQDRSTGARTLLTVPLIGWVAKDATSCGFDSTKVDVNGVPVFPTQSGYDPYRPRCGTGLQTDGVTPITSGFDRQDTSTEANAAFVRGWVSHLVSRFGTAANGGVAYYNLDNEPSLWNSTHRDVHPAPTSYDELRDLTYSHAAAIKAADPSAQTLGPVAYGWTAYFYVEQPPGPRQSRQHGLRALVPGADARLRDPPRRPHPRLPGPAFGDTRVKASSTDEASLAVYAAERSGDGALTVMVINKTGGALAPPLSLGNFSAGASARVFRYSAANLGAIVQEADQPVSGNSLTASYPAHSITLLVIPRAAP